MTLPGPQMGPTYGCKHPSGLSYVKAMSNSNDYNISVRGVTFLILD